uniref:N-acetylglucosamine-6-phosphate deacetylase n=1 Tax=Soboliphyme baturini TaxID=241478 RepID=A0A183II49_9BILA
LHLEGPFISAEKKGAHPRQHLIDGFENGFADILQVYGTSLEHFAYITLAPELKNSKEVIGELVNRQIKVSLGHSAASLNIAEEAILAGASGITHLFNAMSPFHHRDPGLIGVLTSSKIAHLQPIHYGIIADGVHTCDSAICIAYRTNPRGMMLVTDAVPALGLGDGVHHLGDVTVDIRGHRAVLLGTDTLVGSVCSLDECVRYVMKVTECSKEQALECATLHPAEFLGITDRKGTLDFGRDADFVMLDEQLSVVANFIAGKNVFTNYAMSKRPV